MPAILNCLDKPNLCVIGGNHFQFKANQVKYIHDLGIASAIDRLKREDGFILLPAELEHLGHLKEDMFEKVVTPDEKKVLDEKRKEGLNSYIQNLRRLVKNATVSLQKDIDRSGAKYDARSEATAADLERLETLAKYQDADMDKDQIKVDRFKELEEKLLKKS